MTFLPTAFVSQRAVLPTSAYSHSVLKATPLQFDALASGLTTPFASTFSLADEFGFDDPNPLLAGIQGLFSIIGAFVAITLLLSVLVSVFLVPAAAKELEENVKSKYPDLWYEYQAKLEPGEDLSQRPDLMNELGSKFQKLQMEEFDKAAAAVLEEKEGRQDDNSGVIDVEITKETKEN